MANQQFRMASFFRTSDHITKSPSSSPHQGLQFTQPTNHIIPHHLPKLMSPIFELPNLFSSLQNLGVKMVECIYHGLSFFIIEAMQSCSKAASISTNFRKVTNRDKDCCVRKTHSNYHDSTWFNRKTPTLRS